MTEAEDSATAHGVALASGLPRFLICALPRSRTRWLASWLSYGSARVGHDIAVECDTVDQFLDSYSFGMQGTVETGLGPGTKLIPHVRPNLRVVTIRRDRDEVENSLARLGVEVGKQIAEYESELNWLEAQSGVIRLEFDDLNSVDCCAWLFEHCLGVPFDFTWWQLHARRNLQIDFPARLVRLQERQSAMARLRAEAAAGSARWLRIGLEPFSSVWPDAEPMAHLLFSESYGNPKSGKSFDLDWQNMQRLDEQGVIRVVSARLNGELVGWCTWSIGADLESRGRVICNQGAFWAHPRAAGLGIGQKILRRSIELLSKLGVNEFEFHDRPRGRGAKLGALFERLGAKPVKQCWSLEIPQNG